MNIRTLIVMLILSSLAAPGVNAGFWLDDWSKVDLILDCVVKNSEGNYTAFFGYSNANPYAVKIPIGYFNRFSPRPLDRNQTTFFLPGRILKSFSINYDGNKIAWVLNNRRVIASDEIKNCPKSSTISAISGGGISESGVAADNNSYLNESQSNYLDYDPEDNNLDSANESQQNDQEDMQEVPEYTTIGAALALFGAGAYIYYKKKRI